MTHEQLQQAFDDRETVQAEVWTDSQYEQGEIITVTGSKNFGGLMVVTDDGFNWYSVVRWVKS